MKIIDPDEEPIERDPEYPELEVEEIDQFEYERLKNEALQLLG